MIVRLLVLCVGVSLAAVAGWLIVTLNTPTLHPPKGSQWPHSITTLAPEPPPDGRPGA